MGRHFQTGSTMSVKFSHKTNTPTVLRPVDMNRVLQLRPHVLNELPHLGVWTDSQTLWIVFPSVKEDVGVDTSDLAVEFTAYPGTAAQPFPIVCLQQVVVSQDCAM